MYPMYVIIWFLMDTGHVRSLKGMRYSIDRDYGNESSWLPLSLKLTVHFSPTLFFTELLLYFHGIWLAESFPYKFQDIYRHDWNDEFASCVIV